MITDKDIMEITEKIVRYYNPEKVILFGSYVWGNPHPNSDLDFLVVLDTDNIHRTEAEIHKHVRKKFVPMDIIVRTPQDIETSVRKLDPFIIKILRGGKVLYDRRSSS